MFEAFCHIHHQAFCCRSVLKHIFIRSIEVIIYPMPIPPNIKRPCEKLPYRFRTKIIYNNIFLEPCNLFRNLKSLHLLLHLEFMRSLLLLFASQHNFYEGYVLQPRVVIQFVPCNNLPRMEPNYLLPSHLTIGSLNYES